MNDLLKWLLEIGKEAATALMPEIINLVFTKKTPDSLQEVYTKLLETLVASDATTEARQAAQRQLMPIAETIFKHHKAAV